LEKLLLLKTLRIDQVPHSSRHRRGRPEEGEPIYGGDYSGDGYVSLTAAVSILFPLNRDMVRAIRAIK
jgi:hypothetical protein